ncbi:unnamed protein product [Caenorhabditis auriculariae]|uniref:Palmitoyltransferase n=1 Tax=Caenorhabditis auriculariae TaxID=2777116 RepID=A0A8S1GTQ5_9PELO|nr:unnamed protein product [Caenorhabditis auriculariae]
MSWYSKIYIRVREIRSRNPILGWFCTRLLNTMLTIQLLGVLFTVYVYLTVTLGFYVQSSLQASIYLTVLTFLLCMSLWSLGKTIFTPVARVPPRFKPCPELDKKLRSVTPQENGRFFVEKSTVDQQIKQCEILEQMCALMNISVAECDQVGRIKYCYDCGHIKPDRARHCSSCGSCVVKFDHHCPWINKCVSHANYKYFLLYVFYTTILIIWYLLTSAESLVRYFIHQKWIEELKYVGQVVFTMALGGLNETTCEQTKPAVLRFDNRADYNLGRASNLRKVFGWGLWFLPIETSVEDGMHYEIRYLAPKLTGRYVRIEESEELDDSSDVSSYNTQLDVE